MPRAVLFLLCALWVALTGAQVQAAEATLKVGSKRFTESLHPGRDRRADRAHAGARAEHRQGLGNTAVV